MIIEKIHNNLRNIIGDIHIMSYTYIYLIKLYIHLFNKLIKAYINICSELLDTCSEYIYIYINVQFWSLIYSYILFYGYVNIKQSVLWVSKIWRSLIVSFVLLFSGSSWPTWSPWYTWNSGKRIEWVKAVKMYTFHIYHINFCYFCRVYKVKLVPRGQKESLVHRFPFHTFNIIFFLYISYSAVPLLQSNTSNFWVINVFLFCADFLYVPCRVFLVLLETQVIKDLMYVSFSSTKIFYQF